VRAAGLTAAYKDARIGARELAETLNATAFGLKRQARSREDFGRQGEHLGREAFSRTDESHDKNDLHHGKLRWARTATALLFATRGFKVIAMMRKPNDAHWRRRRTSRSFRST